MAKRQKTTRFSIQSYDLAHYRTTEAYAQAVQALYDKATTAVSRAAARGKIDPDKPFSFDMYPSVQKEMQRITEQLASNMQTVIETGSRKQWLFACQKNDGFLASIMDTSKLSKGQLKKMQDQNLDALAAFQGRKVDGMDLSQRIWKYVGQYREQLESALDVGLGEGRSADELSRDVRQNLLDPNRLFRRVRDKRGNLVLSKAARAFHPGRGVYRSSYKNAMRLTRSEINMAYRESDWQRWQSLDFVVGFEIHRSNHEPLCECDICEKLVGRYPKTFKFKGWHPQCMCYATPILMDEETFDENELGDLKAALKGTTYKPLQAKNAVSDVPDGFKDWVKAHVEAQKGWSSTPYFIKDNFVNGQLGKGLKIALPTTTARNALVITKDIQAEIKEVERKWNESQNGKLDTISDNCKTQGIDYREVTMHKEKLSADEVVKRISGGDTTTGSCSSMAFTFAANMGGMDVLDYRGGRSCSFFSRSSNICSIAEKVGGVVNKNYNDFTNAKQLLATTSTDKYYYFTCGKHVAIVRKTEKGYEYLELQSASAERNGWHQLTTESLKNRFGAQKSHTMFGSKYETKDCIIDIDLLIKDAGFRKMMGYINTASGEQKKGAQGGEK